MSWLSDIWDWGVNQVSDSGDWFNRNFSSSGGGWLDKNVTGDNSWLSDNGATVDKYLNSGRKIFNLFDGSSARQNSRSDILGMYEAMAAQDQAYNQQYQQYLEGAQAAAAVNDAARRRAAAEALKIQSKYLKALQKRYQPYVKISRELAPKMAQNYSQYLDTTGLLNQYLTPLAMKGLGSNPTPAYSLDIPKAAYAPTVAPQESVSFPTLDELLAGRK